jgi:hypothetical protein
LPPADTAHDIGFAGFQSKVCLFESAIEEESFPAVLPVALQSNLAKERRVILQSFPAKEVTHVGSFSLFQLSEEMSYLSFPETRAQIAAKKD